MEENNNNNYFGGTNPSTNPGTTPNAAPTNGYQGQPQGGYNYSYAPAQNYGMPAQPVKAGALDYVALILGILSILCCCLGPVSLILGVAAIICMAVSRSKKGKFMGVAIAGLILGIIGLLLGLMMTFGYIIEFQALKELGLSWEEIMELAEKGELEDYLNSHMPSAIATVRGLLGR